FREARQATATDHPDRAGYLNNLGVALQARFERWESRADLDEEIAIFREAGQITPLGDSDRAAILNNLGAALQARFERWESRADLDAAIDACREAVQAIPSSDFDRPAILNNLGNALRFRFERWGDRTDLDSAIEANREAVQATSTDDPDRAGRLNNLGSVLRVRFERWGARADLDSAIDVCEEAVKATSSDHFKLSGRLHNLGNALSIRFERTGTPADLDRMIETLREAVRNTPSDHRNRARMLSGMGVALVVRFQKGGDLADLDSAIETHREAVQATLTDHPYRAAFMNNLGLALVVRFRRGGDFADLDSAIETHREAVQATPTEHPDRAGWLIGLGFALHARYKHVGDMTALFEEIKALVEALRVTAAPPSKRVQAGYLAGMLLMQLDGARAAALVLEEAVWLLAEVAPRELDRGDQLSAVGALAGLAGEAAAAVLADESQPADTRAESALRLLEFGRARVMAQTLEIRSEVTELLEQHPLLARSFLRLRALLDRPEPAAPDFSEAQEVEPGSAQDQRQAAARELRHLLRQIRSLSGFASFALPPTVEDLRAQAREGAVVTLNVTRYRSDALLLTADGVTCVPLPGLDREQLTAQIATFHEALTASNSRTLRARVDAEQQMVQVLGWLWDVVAEPVLEKLGYTTIPRGAWPRVWWAPGGLLGLLPLHAAGHHADPPGPGRRTVLDRVVTSYTPLIGALRYARRPAHVGPDRSLIVAMPTTPGLTDGGRLPNVAREAAMLQSRLPDPTALYEPEPSTTSAVTGKDEREYPTRAQVFTYLRQATIAHFACHGFSDPTDPSHSKLLLHDRDDPLTVASLAPLDLSHARLAYLSACSTAVAWNERLLDEAVNLASGFHLAGFPHVIGTLWTINDKVAVDIADAFYAHLATPDGTLQPDRAAHALHKAIRAQRDRLPRTPSLWGAHLHVGA
ncbi:CHAT domain-containing protein, partial [Streptomyces chryseus]